MRLCTARSARLAALVAAALLLAAPATAHAATAVTIDGTRYEQAFSENGVTWDGARGLTLAAYEGGSITIEGNATVTVAEDSIITATEDPAELDQAGLSARASGDEQGDLTITGAGRLTVNATINSVPNNGSSTGILAHDLTITEGTLTVVSQANVGARGIYATGNLAMVEGSSVSAEVLAGEMGTGIGFGSEGNLEVRGSSVSANEERGLGTWAAGNIVLEDSFIASKGLYNGIFCAGDLLIRNCNLLAIKYEPGAAVECEGTLTLEECGGSEVGEKLDGSGNSVLWWNGAAERIFLTHAGAGAGTATGVRDDARTPETDAESVNPVALYLPQVAFMAAALAVLALAIRAEVRTSRAWRGRL